MGSALRQAFRVLGVSGSPIPRSNTDRALAVALEASGCETEFVKLSDVRVAPCIACLRCVETGRCVIEDDGIALAEKVRMADALLVACYTPYSTVDARTKAFLERLYPLRHLRGSMRGKPGGAIVTSAIPEGCQQMPPAAANGADAIRFYMLEEGMNFLGAVKILGNVPCIRCGHEDSCTMSGLKMIFGRDASVDSVGVHDVEAQPLALAAAHELGRKIGRALRGE